MVAFPYQMAGKACNSYERFEDDIQLLKQMHLGIYRMSIEWCRIEPQKGVFNDEAIQHYLHILQRLKEENIKVCLTLHHVSILYGSMNKRLSIPWIICRIGNVI